MKKSFSNVILLLFFALSLVNCEEDLPLYQIEIETTDGGVTTQSSGQYQAGTELDITAVPDENHEFLNWTGSIESEENPLIIQVCQIENVTANFILKSVDLNLSTIGEGQITQELISGDNTDGYEPGSIIKLSAVPNSGWQFQAWSGDINSSDSSIEITIEESTSITATFIKSPFPLELIVTGEGTVTQSAEGENITLTAQAADNWEFQGWSGDATGTDNEIQITLDAAKSVTATFTKKQYALTVNTIGQGTITQEVIAVAKTTDYDAASTIKLTATPDENWTFTGWSGDVSSSESVIEVTMDTAKDITATFEKIQYALDITIVGQGTVTEEVLSNKTTDYDANTVVKLTATPDDFWRFTGWSGDISSTDLEIEVTMDQAKSITATFAEEQYALEINIVGQGTVDEQIIQNRSTDYDGGTIVQLTATADTGFLFDSWSGDYSGTDTQIQITMDQSQSITATFVADNPVYLDDNGVTVRAKPWATVGMSGDINGETYTIVSLAQLYSKVNNDEDVSKVVTTRVTNMGSLFDDKTTFNQDISSWDTSNVTNMSSMFYNAAAFNQDISYWDVSKVDAMSVMFAGATNFNIDIGNWDVSSVTSMRSMFSNAATFNQDLNSWDVSKVTEMQTMFARATVFNQDLNNWDVSAVTSMNGMFQQTKAFNSNISTWDVSKVTNMGTMFLQAEKFNSDISAWNVGNVTNMNTMFKQAFVFNQDCSNWDVSSVTDNTSFDEYANAWEETNKPSF